MAYYGGNSGFNTSTFCGTSPTHVPANSQAFVNYDSSSPSQSPIHYSLSGTSSPNPYLNAASVSPMHQITKGISGLTTGGGGSITRGTSFVSDTTFNQPLDLTTDTW